MPDYRVRVEDRTFVLLSTVASAASELQIRWLITGATGRVLLLEMVYKLPRGRATEDVDFADKGVKSALSSLYSSLLKKILRTNRKEAG